MQHASAEPPEWLHTLSRAFEGPLAVDQCEAAIGAQSIGALREAHSAQCVREARSGFLALVEPLVALAHAKFQAHVASMVHRRRDMLSAPEATDPLAPEAIEGLFLSGLAPHLLALVSRTLVLELSVARLRGELRGLTPSERFACFTSRLREPDVAIRLFKEYPVLARIVLRALDARVAFYVRLLQELRNDWRAIIATWPALAGTTLRCVSPGLGDPHRRGWIVRVSFSPHGDLIYKPKSLAIDRHLQALLHWLNQRGTRRRFRIMRLLDRGDHGWVEYLTDEPCRTRAQVTRFYERLGGQLALLYALDATDFHYENVLACGEHPMLVDLEALFHPRAQMRQEDSAHMKAVESLARSVVRVGLLPQRVWSTGGFDGIDLSGVGGEPGQRLPRRVPGWEASGTDEMRLVEQEGRLRAARNRPTLRGQPVDVLSDAVAVERGFIDIYLLLRRHRDALLHRAGPLRACAHDEIRTILRPTRVYTWLLRERVHPDLLRNGLDQDRLFDWLWIDVAQQPRLARVVTAEREDVRRGDVPFFTTTPSARAIWTSDGRKIPNFHERSGIDSVEQRLRELSGADLARQRWFLRASLASLAHAEEAVSRVALAPGFRRTRGRPRSSTGSLTIAADRAGSLDSGPRLSGPPAAPAPREHYLEAARLVADRLEQLAFVTEREASWIGVTLLAEQHWSLVPLGLDLYGGLPGVAVFLARLASVSREQRYERLARKATASVLRQLDSSRPSPLVGAFVGSGGVIYALTHLGVLLRDPSLIERAEQTVPWLSRAIAADVHFDVISGSAGAILSLATLHAVTGSSAALVAIRTAAEHLIAHARRNPRGVGWHTPLTGEAPLVGCSHGAAGIALALLSAFALTEDARFERAARGAIAYERSTFSEDARNWPDLRPRAPPRTRPFMTAWCHGATGIGLARLAGLRHADDSNIRDDIAHAVHATLRHGFGGDHSLCHGDLGNLELLACAAAHVEEPGLRSSVACFAAGILRAIREQGWRCGVPLQVQTPGLMVGLAGIGDGLLRVAEPRLPSILMLQPP